MKKYKLLLFLLTISATGFCQTLSISNTPMGATWTINTLTSRVTNSGKNYEHTEISGDKHTQLKVNALLYWSVSVHQVVSSNWDPALKLSVLRTGDGTGGAIISNGTSYILLTNSPQPFFQGALGLGFSRDAIPIQYKIEGLSVMLPVKTYTTTIQYTVVGL